MVDNVEKRILQLLKEIKDDESVLKDLKLKPRNLYTVDDVNLAYSALKKESDSVQIVIDKLFDYYESKLLDFSNLVLYVDLADNPVFSDFGGFLTEDIINAIKSLKSDLERKNQSRVNVKTIKSLIDKTEPSNVSNQVEKERSVFERTEYYKEYEREIKKFNDLSFDVQNKIEVLSSEIASWADFSDINSFSLDQFSKKPVLPF
jgi:hypothetical protein